MNKTYRFEAQSLVRGDIEATEIDYALLTLFNSKKFIGKLKKRVDG